MPLNISFYVFKHQSKLDTTRRSATDAHVSTFFTILGLDETSTF